MKISRRAKKEKKKKGKNRGVRGVARYFAVVELIIIAPFRSTID